jgi:hypothetical protein
MREPERRSAWRVRTTDMRRSTLTAAVVAAIAALLVMSALRDRGAAAPVDQCVACHTDVAKLRALTPPDPPPTEAGEG